MLRAGGLPPPRPAGRDNGLMEPSEVVRALWNRIQARDRAASFWTVADGKIIRGTEYRTSLGADASPDWRADLVERY